MLSKIFSPNKSNIKKYLKEVKIINSFYEEIKNKSDEEIKKRFEEIKKETSNSKELELVKHEVFALIKEASSRTLNMLPYDVQLVGGLTLNDNKIAEMKTGEGKTLVASLPAILNSLIGNVHVVTVNDYLAKRDAEILEPLYNYFGLSVGIINDSTLHIKKEEYLKDIIYATNHELGFDYLRDNMVFRTEEKTQRELDFVIVDEIDSILIDEARNPLIISGEANLNKDLFIVCNEIRIELEEGEEIRDKYNKIEEITGDFILDLEGSSVYLTENGIHKIEKKLTIDNLYEPQNAIIAHNVENSLKAHNLLRKDKEYVIKDNEIVIVDEFTGRLSEGRRFGEGLHQAIEAKEKIEIKAESQTLNSTTYQNYFKTYKKLSGMTGTRQTEATEFGEIYNLDVISIPTNKPIKRKDGNDLIYLTEEDKFNAIYDKIIELNKKEQPVLIGTASIEKSELLAKFLEDKNIPHNVLNAKNHEREAEIIENAGQKGAVTVATNMAGRGVDIKINDEVKELGGLFILGTERHDSRRIDNQLRGRSGRQGDNGESIFYLSLDDNLIKIFGGDKLKTIVSKLGLQKGENIDSGMVSRSIEKAQKKIEDMNFESRKYLVKFDDIINNQRKVIYSFRNKLLTKDINIIEKNKENLDYLLSGLLTEIDIIDGFTDVENLTEEDYSKIKNIFTKFFHFQVTDFEDLKFEDVNNMREQIKNIIIYFHSQNIQIIETKEELESIYCNMYIQVLDILWRSHLHDLDTLRSGIGLRSYNQKDPLTEFQKDSFHMFERLMGEVKKETRKAVFNIVLQKNEEAPLNNDMEISKEEEIIN